MLDIKRIRQNPQQVLQALHTRSADLMLDNLLLMDEQRRRLLAEAEEKKARRNAASKQLGIAKKKGASAAETDVLMEEMRHAGTEIEALDAQIAQIDQQMEQALYTLPNLPHESVPVGADNHANTEVRSWGTPRAFLWEPKSHQDIGADLGLLFKESNSHSAVYRGMGARLKRAVINFLLDMHTSAGYEEVYFPASGASEQTEGSILQLYRDRILNAAQMPICHCHTAKAEFDQSAAVELISICHPEESDTQLEQITASAEKSLQLLGLPYRVVCLCTGKLDFSAAKTYAVEVWMPSCNRYVEISSCSNCEDFLARRTDIRFRCNAKEKPQYVHTLKGSSAVIERMVDAILENFQNDDGTVSVPEVLVPYMQAELIK